MGRTKKMENEKKNFIADHALLTEENFLIAAQVANSFEEIINRLVNKLLIKLEEELSAILGLEWEVEYSFDDNAFDGWYFCIFKKKWLRNEQALYDFGLRIEGKKLNGFYFYAIRNTDVMKKPLNAVNQALNEQYKKGRKAVSDWWQYVDHDYRNWTHDETLVKLYRQEEMITYLIEQFIKIKTVIEPIIDEEVKKYSEIM